MIYELTSVDIAAIADCVPEKSILKCIRKVIFTSPFKKIIVIQLKMRKGVNRTR